VAIQTDVTILTVRRELPIAPHAATMARRAVDELEEAGLSSVLLDDLRLLVTEVVTNAVRHGPEHGSIELSIRAGGGGVRVEVSDPGRGFVYDGPTGPADTEGGWGLYLLDRLADRWGIIEEPRTRVWFEMSDRPATVARVDEATLFDAIAAAIIATDPDGIVTHWNHGAEQLFGFARDETIGRPITDLLVAPDDAASAEVILTRIREGRGWEGEWEAPARDGERVPVWIANAPVHDPRGRLVGIVGLSIDMSESRATESALRRSEERLRVALEAGAMGTWEWDIERGVVHWSEMLERIHGLEPGTFPGTFEAYQADMHADDRERVLAAIRRVVEERAESYAVEYRIVTPAGATRWLNARAALILDEAGEPARLVGVCTDVTVRKVAERRLVAQHAVASLLAEAASIEVATPAILGAIGENLGWEVGALHLIDQAAGRTRCVGTWVRTGRPEGRLIDETRRLSTPIGEGLPGLVWQEGHALWFDDVVTDARFVRGAAAAEEHVHAAIGFPMRVGSQILGVLEFFGHEIQDPDDGLLRLLDGIGGQIGLVVARRRAEEQRAELLAKEREARAEAEEANERLGFLAEASMLLATSLDYQRTLAELVRLSVPRLADWCAVELMEGGVLKQIEVAHVDPTRVALAEEYRRRFPTPPDSPTGVPNVIRTGRSELYSEIPDEMLAAAIDDPEQLAMIRELGLRSIAVVPLVARGRAIGAITLAMSGDTDRRLDDDDLVFAEHLARRAALSIDNARLYEDRARIARTLQRSLLPPTLPAVPRVELAAVYQAASIQRNDVGGDFYDVFEVGGDTWALGIGDVCGKGVEAAALTGLVRHSLRAQALKARAPAEVLRALNDNLRRHDTERFSTVALAFVQPNPVGVRCTVACAGHPPPLILRADGTVEPLGAIGTLLGVLDEITVEDRSADLEPGDALILYTDGLLDPRRAQAVDEDGLAGLLAAQAGAGAQEIVDELGSAVEDPTSAPDDVAILALRVRPS